MKKLLSLFLLVFVCLLANFTLAADILQPPVANTEISPNSTEQTNLTSTSITANNPDVPLQVASVWQTNNLALKTYPELNSSIVAIYSAFAVIMLALFIYAFLEMSVVRLASVFIVSLFLIYTYIITNYSISIADGGKISNINLILSIIIAASLFSYTHLVRILLNFKKASLPVNISFLIIAVGLAMLGLLPIFPKFNFLLKYTEIWGLLLIIPLLVSLFAWLKSSKGLNFYILSNFIIVLGSFLALVTSFKDPNILFWRIEILASLVLASFFLLFINSKKTSQQVKTKTSLELNKNEAPVELNQARIIPDIMKIETSLRKPLDVIMENACNLDLSLENSLQSLEPVLKDKTIKVRNYADNMISASKQIAQIVNFLPEFIEDNDNFEQKSEFFNLQNLLAAVYNDLSNKAAERKITFSWFMSPNISNYYKGDSQRLQTIIHKLAENAIRANRGGSVRLSVDRFAKDINKLGSLEFVITDTGSGMPPKDRSSLALAKAWEFAARYNGGVFIETSPDKLEIKLRICLEAYNSAALPIQVNTLREHYDPSLNEKNVLIISQNTNFRALIGGYAIRLKHKIIEADNANLATSQYEKYYISHIIIDATMPINESIELIAAIRLFEGHNSIKNIPIIAIAENIIQAEKLVQAGASNYLLNHFEFQNFAEIFSLAFIQNTATIKPIFTQTVEEKIEESKPVEIIKEEIVEPVIVEPLIIEPIIPEPTQDIEKAEQLDDIDPFDQISFMPIDDEVVEPETTSPNLDILPSFEVKPVERVVVQKIDAPILIETPSEPKVEKFIIQEVPVLKEPKEKLEVPAFTSKINKPIEAEKPQVVKHNPELKVIPIAKPNTQVKQGGLLSKFFRTKDAISSTDEELIQLKIDEASEFVSAPKPVEIKKEEKLELSLEKKDENTPSPSLDILPHINTKPSSPKAKKKKNNNYIMPSLFDSIKTEEIIDLDEKHIVNPSEDK